MGITYEDLLWCEHNRTECPEIGRLIVETTELAYGPRNPSHGSCPPGAEPPPYQGVAAAAINASNAKTWLDLDAAEQLQVERYVLERYDEAHAAWRDRYAFCGWQDPEPPKPPPGFPPSKPPKQDKPIEAVRSDPLVVVLVMAGLGIYASRARGGIR